MRQAFSRAYASNSVSFIAVINYSSKKDWLTINGTLTHTLYRIQIPYARPALNSRFGIFTVRWVHGLNRICARALNGTAHSLFLATIFLCVTSLCHLQENTFIESVVERPEMQLTDKWASYEVDFKEWYNDRANVKVIYTKTRLDVAQTCQTFKLLTGRVAKGYFTVTQFRGPAQIWRVTRLLNLRLYKSWLNNSAF